MVKQAGRVQLEQSVLFLAWNLAQMAKGGFSCAGIEETQQLIENARDEV
jgi:hypothetical protein